jgi:DNA processing protein
MCDSTLEGALRLSFCRGIGPRLGTSLLDRVRDPRVLFSPGAGELGLPPGLLRRLQDPGAARAAEREIRDARARGYRLIAFAAPHYPELLRHLPDPPLVLRVWGELRRDDQLAVAVVGTRRATAYGRRQAARFTRELAGAGLVIVSGLARGIDGIAHEEALRAGGRTIAVLGSGLGRIYPPEHRDLAVRIAARGAVVSEFPLAAPPLSHNFPRRNRIISGLSLGVLVVEGSARSGAIITASFAAEQGRQVFAVPGHVDAPVAEGVNELLRDGATLAARPEDILTELGRVAPLPPAAGPKGAAPPLDAEEERVLAHTTPGRIDPEALAGRLALDVGHVLATLTSLEIKGYLRRFGDGLERID